MLFSIADDVSNCSDYVTVITIQYYSHIKLQEYPFTYNYTTHVAGTYACKPLQIYRFSISVSFLFPLCIFILFGLLLFLWRSWIYWRFCCSYFYTLTTCEHVWVGDVGNCVQLPTHSRVTHAHWTHSKQKKLLATRGGAQQWNEQK